MEWSSPAAWSGGWRRSPTAGRQSPTWLPCRIGASRKHSPAARRCGERGGEEGEIRREEKRDYGEIRKGIYGEIRWGGKGFLEGMGRLSGEE